MGKSPQIYGKSCNVHGGNAVEAIFDELLKAETKHPGWPADLLHAIAIIAEELGEATQAAIDHVYAGGSIDDVHKELAQTGAMVIRAMIHLDRAQPYQEIDERL